MVFTKVNVVHLLVGLERWDHDNGRFLSLLGWLSNIRSFLLFLGLVFKEFAKSFIATG